MNEVPTQQLQDFINTMQETSASDVISTNQTAFGRYQIISQLPHPVDGWKVVLRRILISIMTFKDEFKSVKMVSATMENHPHGDQSIYQAAIRLGQDFEFNPPLINFIGQVGTYDDPSAASMRYTAAEVSEFCRAVFFDGVDYKTIPKQVNETLDGYEPVYLTSVIPTAFLYANNSIGWGFSSYTVPHNTADVCDLAAEYCRHRRANPFLPFDYAKHAEKFLPDFPVPGFLANHRQLIAQYKQGNFNHHILTEGIAVLCSDAIHILSLPYGVSFGQTGAKTKSLKMVIENLILEEKGGWFDKNILWVRLSSIDDKSSVCVKLKRGVNVFEMWERLRKRISFSQAFTPIPNYNQDGYPEEIFQPELLRIWYEARYNIVVASKKIKITELTDDLRKVEARLIVCDHMDAVIKLLRENDKPTGVQRLQEVYQLTWFQATYLSLTPLNILSKTSKEEQQALKDDLEKQLREIRDSFQNIPEEMAAHALAIKKRFPVERRTKIPSYVGYVRIGGGCIQLENVDEIPVILERFPRETLEIYRYEGPHLYRVTENGKLEMGYIPKITVGDIYGLKTDLESNPRSERVITVNIDDGTACCVKGFIPGLRKEGYFYTTPISKAIYRNGRIETIEVTKELSPRKTICRGAATDIIYVYPEPKNTHYVFALNTSTPNLIAIQKVSPERNRIALDPTGTPFIVHSTDPHVFLNIPPEYLNRNSTRVVEFLDLEKLFGDRSQLRINISTEETKKNKLIRLL